MTDKIYLYELECYRKASEEQREKMRVRETRYFELEGLPSKSIQELLEAYLWERGKQLAPSSLSAELLFYNNIRSFLIERNIKKLSRSDEKNILQLLKGWMLEHGYALTSQKYRAAYDVVAAETSGIEKYMKKILRFSEVDDRDEVEKDVWNIDRLGILLRENPINNIKTLNFTRIWQPDIREEMKKAAFLHLKYFAVHTVLGEITAMNRFSKYLKKKWPDIISLQELERTHIEEYLIYLKTEAYERKNYRSDLYALRRVIEEVGKLYEQQSMQELFLNNDFPSTPKYNFKFYSDTVIKRLNAHIFKMDEQISRALIIHQLLGTRISDTLTLQTDCLSIKMSRYFVRIDQVKSITFEKAISDELAQLIIKAIEYTKERYGDTKYIFVNANNPKKPYQYGMIQNQIMTMIRQEDIRDDNGELLKFGTHIFRHCYGKKLTEMHIEDWMIAKLLGHKTLQTVHYYRRIGNQVMADETRPAREEMDRILLEIVESWDGYEI